MVGIGFSDYGGILLFMAVIAGVALLLQWARRRPSSKTPSQLRKRALWIIWSGVFIGLSMEGVFLQRNEPKPPQEVQFLGVLIAFLALCVGGWTRSRANFVEQGLEEKLAAKASSRYEQARQAGVHTPSSDVGVGHTDLRDHLSQEHDVVDFSSSTAKLIERHDALHSGSPPQPPAQIPPPQPPPSQSPAPTPPTPPSAASTGRSGWRMPEPLVIGITIVGIVLVAAVVLRMTGGTTHTEPVRGFPSFSVPPFTELPPPLTALQLPDQCAITVQNHLKPDPSAFPYPPLSRDETKNLLHATKNWLEITYTLAKCVNENPGLENGDLALVSMAAQLDLAASAGFLEMPRLRTEAQVAMGLVVIAYPEGCVTDLAQEYLDTRHISIDTLNAGLQKIEARECNP